MINITITNTTIDNTYLRFGRFIEESSISVRIENCYIRSSRIYIYWLSQPAVIRNCYIRSLEIKIQGLSQPVVINNCTFHGDTRTDNAASPEVMSRNKGVDEHLFISCFLSNIIMVNVVVRDNVGPGMWFFLCNVHITDSCFTNNNVTSLIYSSQSELKIENSHFLNYTNIYGGISLNENSKANVINSTFTGNQCHALVMRQSQATTVGCQFLDNAVKSKGAAVHVSHRSEYHDQGSWFTDNVAGEGGKILNKKNHSLKLFKMITEK